MVDGPADPTPRLIEDHPVVPQPFVEPPVLLPEPEPLIVDQPAPALLNDRERQRMSRAMEGLARFGPIAEPQRPAPRTEVDPLSSVSEADWSGLDGLGESIPMTPRSEPVFTSARRESVATPVLDPVAAANPVPIPTTDPARGWVTADRLFSDFGD